MKTRIKRWRKRGLKIYLLLVLMCLLTFICRASAYASEAREDNTQTQEETGEAPVREPTQTAKEGDGLQLNISSNAGSTSLSATLQMLLMLTILTIAPSILLMVTSFTRIIIVLHFVRAALGTQTTPPNQVLIGLALFLTFFIMNPVLVQANNEALKPLAEGKMTQEEAIGAGVKPFRDFMYKQIGGENSKDLHMLVEIADMTDQIEKMEDIPTTVLIPAFMLSELREAFIMGFVIYLPFIVIDMVVASTLMSMGMMMLPPTTISMPFKILLFIMADGWNLIVGELVKTFFINYSG